MNRSSTPSARTHLNKSGWILLIVASLLLPARFALGLGEEQERQDDNQTSKPASDRVIYVSKKPFNESGSVESGNQLITDEKGRELSEEEAEQLKETMEITSLLNELRQIRAAQPAVRPIQASPVRPVAKNVTKLQPVAKK